MCSLMERCYFNPSKCGSWNFTSDPGLAFGILSGRLCKGIQKWIFYPSFFFPYLAFSFHTHLIETIIIPNYSYCAFPLGESTCSLFTQKKTTWTLHVCDVVSHQISSGVATQHANITAQSEAWCFNNEASLFCSVFDFWEQIISLTASRWPP